MISSSGSAALLRALEGDTERAEDTPRRGMPRAFGPTLVKLSDPQASAELAVELLDELTPAGRARNQHLKRRDRGVTVDADGAFVLNGRACCAALAKKINASLHVIAIPSEHVCTCGTVWAVQQNSREERRHVW